MEKKNKREFPGYLEVKDLALVNSKRKYKIKISVKGDSYLKLGLFPRCWEWSEDTSLSQL